MNDDTNRPIEEAIAGTRRGERWEDAKGFVLVLDNRAISAYEKDGGYHFPSLTGWHLVEEPLKCPHGHEAYVVGTSDRRFRVVCKGQTGMCWMGPMADSKAEAIAAWKLIGGVI